MYIFNLTIIYFILFFQSSLSYFSSAALVNQTRFLSRAALL